MLLDTSGLYSFLDADDPWHGDANSLLDQANVRLTHNYVLTELIALCNARGLHRPAVHEFMRVVANDPNIEIFWIEQRFHDAAVELLQQRLDKDYSLCDAVSFLLMRQRGIYETPTTDHHFEQEGFVRLLQR